MNSNDSSNRRGPSGGGNPRPQQNSSQAAPKPGESRPQGSGGRTSQQPVSGKPQQRPGAATSGGQQQRPGARQPQRSGNARPGGYQPQQRPRNAPPRPAIGSRPAAPIAAKDAAPPVIVLELPESITVRELAQLTRRSPIEIIKVLMNSSIMASINQTIDFDTAALVGAELGIEIKPVKPPVVEEPVSAEPVQPKTAREKVMEQERPEDLVSRPPVATVLGHVDHGKTTLLDAIRRTNVAAGESGGITQHVGAYQVEIHGRKITFLDTPGHAAFTAMRARGAQVTDVAILVVAADDGVMPQTREAIDHARAARVPIVVAINKVDMPGAQPERVKQQLSDLGLVAEDWGGDVIMVRISAKQRQGIEDLLENVLLVADVAALRANPNKPATGAVIEARMDRSLGPAATLLIHNGTLRVGESLVAGQAWGRVRAMYDDHGNQLSAAPPSTPVVVAGLSEVPNAGDTFEVVADERTARITAEERMRAQQASSQVSPIRAVTLDALMAQIKAGKTKELTLILKADVQGSIEPIINQLARLGDENLKVKVLHQGIGNINESDVMLAIASQVIIVGFDVEVDAAARRTADAQGVDIRLYDIIYRLVDDMDKALKGLLEPVYTEVIIGHAEVRQVFKLKKGKVAGCYVTDGVITRGSQARIRREVKDAYNGRIASIHRFTEDINEAKTNMECGITLESYEAYAEGDVIEVYKKERVS